MPKLIDHDRIELMAAEMNIPDAIIAQRLRVSERTVRRVRAERGIEPGTSEVVGTEDEWRLWELWRSWRRTPSEIAYRFGYSRQHMHNYFSQPRQVEGAPI